MNKTTKKNMFSFQDLRAQKQRQVEEKLNSSKHPFVSADLDSAVHWDGRALSAILAAERYGLQQYVALPTRIIDVQIDANYPAYKSEVARWVCDVSFCYFKIAIFLRNYIF